MTYKEWLARNEAKLGSPFEGLFVREVLANVNGIDFSKLQAQFPFRDRQQKQRYADFSIQETDGVRIILEVDGYNKTGHGPMSRNEFKDWQRRHASLVSAGWDVIRFANADVRDRPFECAEHIELLLKNERKKAAKLAQLEKERKAIEEELRKQRNKEGEDANIRKVKKLTEELNKVRGELQNPELGRPSSDSDAERLEALRKKQEARIAKLSRDFEETLKDNAIMKHAIWAFAAIITIMFVAILLFAIPRFDSVAPSDTRARHIEDPTSEDPQQVAPERTLASCQSAISWDEAHQYQGKTIAVTGPVVEIASRMSVEGNPTFLNVGRAFPSRQRLSLVIWGRNRHEFESAFGWGLEGKDICAKGKIEMYRGVPQMELSFSDQLHLM